MRDKNYLDIAQEATDVFGLGESPVLFARYPDSKRSQPDIPQPTNLLKPLNISRTRAHSVGLERKFDLEDANSASTKAASSSFKATEGQKEVQTVPCVFKWTPKSAAAISNLNTHQKVNHIKVQ